MATPLFIKTEDIVKFTPLNGNVDVDKFIQFSKVAHEIHLQNWLGTDLFDKIGQDIIDDTLTGDYLTLVNKYIKPMALWYSFYEYLPFAPYTIANQGVYKHLSENSETIQVNENDTLQSKTHTIAEHYATRFVKHMCFNSTTYPEYNSNSDGDMHPDKDVNFTNWFL